MAHEHIPVQSETVQIRETRVEDVDAIFALIDEASRTTTVLPRSRDNIRLFLADFLIAEQDGRILGCGALNHANDSLAEIKSLVVAAETRGLGLGSRLVRALLDKARREGIRRVFALTDNPPFFARFGFLRTAKETFPHKVWNECIHCPKFFDCEEEAVDLLLELPAEAGGDGGDA